MVTKEHRQQKNAVTVWFKGLQVQIRDQGRGPSRGYSQIRTVPCNPSWSVHRITPTG